MLKIGYRLQIHSFVVSFILDFFLLVMLPHKHSDDWVRCIYYTTEHFVTALKALLLFRIALFWEKRVILLIKSNMLCWKLLIQKFMKTAMFFSMLFNWVVFIFMITSYILNFQARFAYNANNMKESRFVDS